MYIYIILRLLGNSCCCGVYAFLDGRAKNINRSFGTLKKQSNTSERNFIYIQREVSSSPLPYLVASFANGSSFCPNCSGGSGGRG